jgi:pantoate--beta-alanine ligase
MKMSRTIAETRSELASVDDIGLVPTMGALHAGHLALLEAARDECEFVVATLFVNPVQFGPDEDYERYPRDEEADAQAAAAAGVDLFFIPAVEEMYPEGFRTWVDAEGAGGHEGEARPGHFRGVATVCLKLFNIIGPTRAYFGQKDARQIAVIKQLVRDLNLDVHIRVVPTVRDPDGLAVSSRNAYLSPAEREQALALPRALAAGAAADRRGESAVDAVRASMNGLQVDYIAEEIDADNRRVLEAAVRVGQTRLIDNVILEGDS